jgi:hypothetical protein
MKTQVVSPAVKKVLAYLNYQDGTEENEKPWSCWYGSDHNFYASFKNDHVIGGDTDRQALNRCYNKQHPTSVDICGELEEEWEMEQLEKEEKQEQKVVQLKTTKEKKVKEKVAKQAKEPREGVQRVIAREVFMDPDKSVEDVLASVLSQTNSKGERWKTNRVSLAGFRSGTIQRLEVLRELAKENPDHVKKLLGL